VQRINEGERMSKIKYLLIKLVRITMAGLMALSLTGAGAGLTAASTIGTAAVLVGCTGGVPVGLGEPTVVCPDAPPEPVLNEEQRTRQEQVKVYLAQVYTEARWRILLTTKDCAGNVWDFLDPATVPGSEIEPPPPPEYIAPDDVEPAVTELEEHPELTLPDAVAMWRPSFMPYVLGDSRRSRCGTSSRRRCTGGPMGRRTYTRASTRSCPTSALPAPSACTLTRWQKTA
jgi:hypothetical protein